MRIYLSILLWTGAVLLWAAAGWELELFSGEWWLRLFGTLCIILAVLEIYGKVMEKLGEPQR
jgi:hypothetical protein